MTTLILALATSPETGLAFAGPFGAAAAQLASYAVAGYIDSRYVLPKLFPPPDVPPPNVGDIQFQFAEEGATLSLLVGAEVVVTGGLIWASDIIVVEHHSGGGGCGGPPAGTSYDLYVHCEVVIGEAPTDAGIVEVIKVWKDGEVFFESNPDVNIVSDQLTAAIYGEIVATGEVHEATNTAPITVHTTLKATLSSWVRVSGAVGNAAANGDWRVFFNTTDPTAISFVYDLVGSDGTASGAYDEDSATIGRLIPSLEIQSPSGGPDLTQLRVGVDTVISGWTAPATADNGTFKCTYVGTTTGGGTIARFENINAVAKAAGDTVTIVQDVPQFNSRDATSVTIHDGSLADTADALVEGIEGVGNVPAYRRCPRMVVERLRVTENGGRIGEFKFLVKQTGTSTRAAIISTLLEHGQLEASQYDVTDVSGNFRGMSTNGIGSAISRLQPVCLAHDILAQQKGELIRFFDHDNAIVVPILPGDLAAHEDGSEHPEPLDVPDPPDSKLPSEVVVSYLDPRTDWQSGSVRERKRKVIDQDEVAQVQLPMVMTAGEARGLARRLLWLAWGQRHHPRFALPPSSLTDAVEGNIFTLSLHGEDWRLMLRKVDVGVNWLIQCEGEVDDPQLATILDGPFEDPTGDQPPPVALPGELAIVLADLPPLLSNRVGFVGFYYMVALQDPNEIFSGAALFASDDFTNYTNIDAIGAEGVIGTASTVLSGLIGTEPVPTDFFDEASTVTVILKHGSLESKSRDLVLSGENRAVLGPEVIAFRTATLTAERTYVLSGLLRGLYDTEDQVERHMGGENFMLLNDVSMHFVEIGLSQLGNLRSYKPVVSGGSVTQATGHDFSVDGTCVRHWDPTHAILRKELTTPTNDVNIRWNRRCLEPVSLFGPYPLSDESESYEIEVWDAGFANLKRTLISTVEEVDYTGSQQTTDFGSPPSTYNLRVFQIHTLTGRSKRLEVAAQAPQETY